MRFSDNFVDTERVGELQGTIEEAIGESLLSTKLQVTSKDGRRHGLQQKLTNILE